MKKSFLSALAIASLAAPIAIHAQQPPIIDRQLFFGEVQISGAQISPDGQYISFLKPYKGTRNIWVKKAGEPFSAARPVSAEATRPVRNYFWSRDSKYILYVQDAAGDENFNIYAIDPSVAADSKTGVPPTRALTNLKGVRTEIFAVPKSKPDILYIGLNDRDPRWHDLYELHLSTGEKKLIRKNTEEIASWDFDHDGNLRLAERTNKAGDTEILRVDPDGFKQIYSCSVLEGCGVEGFDAANKLVYLTTNKGALNLSELETMDPATGVTTKLESDPENRVDIAGVVTSDVDHRILFTQYEDDRYRLYFRDKEFEKQYHWLQTKLPGKELHFGAHSSDENIWILSASSDTEPGETYVWNRSANTLALQYRIREELPRASLSERKPYHFKSSDGLDIPAYLTLPKGLAAKNLPLIVFPHGGPWARDSFGFDTFAQFFANRGYAVLQPNFRSSTGYGKKFLNAGNGEWGRKMQDDLTWGVKALVADGTVDSKKVGIFGGSYGGYATLAGVAFTPDVYAAAVAYVAPSNLITLLDAIPPYWEAGRKQMYTRMADPTTADGKALLVAESPLTQAKAIVTPLMVVQGKNDPRVNVRESNQIVAAVRDNGKPVEYLVAPDEGHGFARPINNLAMVAAMEEFFAKYLGGRYQKEVPTDVEAKLKEITVDPKTVSGDVKLNGALGTTAK
ncbi:alpha/beta hydrolase family protein [Tunturiibacter lichenicola]|uniref:alpha/beta hydrolase family protein n=1 Tax=Tunturiibacter lichenicola TaxID=2051959 RepID=UPI0021B399EF|nr:S9 family peptidase [Edaphobacter lichenicola]